MCRDSQRWCLHVITLQVEHVAQAWVPAELRTVIISDICTKPHWHRSSITPAHVHRGCAYLDFPIAAFQKPFRQRRARVMPHVRVRENRGSRNINPAVKRSADQLTRVFLQVVGRESCADLVDASADSSSSSSAWSVCRVGQGDVPTPLLSSSSLFSSGQIPPTPVTPRIASISRARSAGAQAAGGVARVTVGLRARARDARVRRFEDDCALGTLARGHSNAWERHA